jgi:hypothetical protein
MSKLRIHVKRNQTEAANPGGFQQAEGGPGP